MEKAVELKVKECKEIVIQGMEKSIQHKMVYMFLKDHKIESFVKNFTVNSKVGTIKQRRYNKYLKDWIKK